MPHFSRQRGGVEESVPAVQFDYTNMTGVSGPKALSIVDRDTSNGTSSVASDRHAVALGVQFLDHLPSHRQIFQGTSSCEGGSKRFLQEQLGQWNVFISQCRDWLAL